MRKRILPWPKRRCLGEHSAFILAHICTQCCTQGISTCLCCTQCMPPAPARGGLKPPPEPCSKTMWDGSAMCSTCMAQC